MYLTCWLIQCIDRDPRLFVYCCDFSSTAVDLVRVSTHSYLACYANHTRYYCFKLSILLHSLIGTDSFFFIGFLWSSNSTCHYFNKHCTCVVIFWLTCPTIWKKIILVFIIVIYYCQENEDYDTSRCHAFVCDIADTDKDMPFPDNSLDIITMIFVLSAIAPER